MHAEGNPPAGGAGGPLSAGVLLALKPLLELASAERAGAAGSVEVARIARRSERLTLLLLGFYLDMARGMHEFRRAYGLPAAAEAPAGMARDLAREALSREDEQEVMARIDAGIQELKLHHAALLEAYHEATHRGTREILRTLDPEVIGREFRGSSVRVGPLRLPSTWRPVLVQAIWEEFLHRFRRLAGLEAADYEKFFREGFRDGYQRFHAARQRRAEGMRDGPEEEAGRPA